MAPRATLVAARRRREAWRGVRHGAAHGSLSFLFSEAVDTAGVLLADHRGYPHRLILTPLAFGDEARKDADHRAAPEQGAQMVQLGGAPGVRGEENLGE